MCLDAATVDNSVCLHRYLLPPALSIWGQKTGHAPVRAGASMSVSPYADRQGAQLSADQRPGPVSASARTKRSQNEHIRSSQPKCQPAAFLRLFAKEAKQICRADPGGPPSSLWDISHLWHSNVCRSGNPPNRGVLRTRLSQRGQRGAAGLELSQRLSRIAKASFFAREIAAMSWLARSKLRAKGS